MMSVNNQEHQTTTTSSLKIIKCGDGILWVFKIWIEIDYPALKREPRSKRSAANDPRPLIGNRSLADLEVLIKIGRG